MGDLAALSPTHDLSHLMAALDWIPKHRRRLAVDGGAHTGAWTSLLASEFQHVVAFEPCDRYADMIDDSHNVTVHRVALGSQMESCTLAQGTDNEGQCHVVPGTGKWVVPLDAFELPNLDLLKLDVEGFEQPALEGAKATIEHWRPWVLIEQNDLAEVYYGADPDAPRKRLRQWGYREVAHWNKDHLYAP